LLGKRFRCDPHPGDCPEVIERVAMEVTRRMEVNDRRISTFRSVIVSVYFVFFEREIKCAGN
jgi:hypothetical protein